MDAKLDIESHVYGCQFQKRLEVFASMQYWTNPSNRMEIAVFFLLCSLWTLGGCLLVSRAFHLEPQENLVAGFAARFLLFIALINLPTQIIPF